MQTTAKRTLERDVAVIGAKSPELAGLVAALRLVELGASVAVIGCEWGTRGGSGDPPLVAAEGGAGLVLTGLAGDALSIASEHGAADYRLLASLAAENAALLREIAKATGAERCVASVTTRRTLAEGASLDGELELLRSAGALARRDGDAIVVENDLRVDVPRLTAAIESRLRALGVEFVAAPDAIGRRALESDVEGAVIALPSGPVRVTRVVLAGGAWLTRLDPWMSSLAIAARAQELVTAPISRDFAPRVHGAFAECAQRADGRIVACEARAVANRGDAFDPAPEPAIQKRLEELVCEVAGIAAGELTIESRRARPRLYSCDGLPLVGPHPYRPACVLAAGFSGLELALSVSSGRAAAEWIVDGLPRDAAAKRLSPRRML